MDKKYFCCDKKRSNEVSKHTTLNGIAYMEVFDDQKTFQVHFLKSRHLNTLKKSNILIEGGERIKDILIDTVTVFPANVVQVKVDKTGDFSQYTLRLIEENNIAEPPKGFDPILSSVNFLFTINCAHDFDCRAEQRCFPPPVKEPDINYLAKDYAGFRQIMLDRMSVLMPGWKERNPADSGIALVELLAYIGDHLSYQQDAIATEAYLGTARRRISVKRHVRLVDYCMHDGCNARVWMQIKVASDTTKVPRGTQILTKLEGFNQRIPQTLYDEHKKDIEQNAEFFETMYDVELFKDHNRISFYTWGDERCCLPRGATSATLSGHFPNLKTGDVLIFTEDKGPITGKSEDKDPGKRHPVRLTKVELLNASGLPLKDPLYDKEITEIEWNREDALPFPLCISSVESLTGEKQLIDEVSIALGNIVLADHGLTIKDEEIGEVPAQRVSAISLQKEIFCKEHLPQQMPLRFSPVLKNGPVTQRTQIMKTVMVNGKKQTQSLPFDPDGSAQKVFQSEIRETIPAITLKDNDENIWTPKSDLLSSGEFAREFVVETETDGTASIRFGDDINGKRPDEGTLFQATYRVGNGIKGNIGAETIVHIITHDTSIEGVRNPLPAKGGLEPMSIEKARQSAPWAFRVQERAVTPEDYAMMAEKHPEVQKAVANFRWTGSWTTVFIAIDRYGGLPVDENFEYEIRNYLEKYRMAGHDLEIEGPQYVSLEITMQVCVKPDYFRSDVKSALLRLFSNRILSDGRYGVFYPDNFTFGQAVYLSRLYEAAQSVDGVQSVQIKKFQRQGVLSNEAVDSGKLIIGRCEIARLDNDPNFPEHGVFNLDVKGGK